MTATIFGSATIYPGSSLEIGSGSSVAAYQTSDTSDGTFNLSAGSTLTFTVNSALGDLLSTAGMATLDGTLNLALGSGFVPCPGESFQLSSFASEAGRFAAVNLPALPAGESWDASGLYTTGRLTVVAEPMTAATLGIVAAAGVVRRRHR